MKTESDHPLLESNSSMLDDRRQNAWRVFLEWCFLREATGIRSFIVLLIPVLASAFLIRNSLWYFPLASPIAAQGRSLFHQILSVGIFFTFAASAYHASRAVCWEMSRELRDLVRLTGLNPLVLLWGEYWRPGGRFSFRSFCWCR